MSVLTVVSKSLRVLQWRSLSVDQSNEIVRVAGIIIPMSKADFRVVEFLVCHRDIAFSKAAILDALYGPGHGRDLRQVDIFVARLQRTFEAAGVGEVISTVAGRGYSILDDDGAIDDIAALRPRNGAQLCAA